jgi:hypothetical protein
LKETFLSYSHDDKGRAGQVKQILELNGVTAFLAHETLEVSIEWRREILRHLETSSALIALVTNSFARSMWANQEVGVAFAKGLALVPLIFGPDSELKGFLEMFQGVQVTDEDLSSKVKSVIPRITEGKSPIERREQESETRVLALLKSKVDSYSHLLADPQRHFEKIVPDETPVETIAIRYSSLTSLINDFRGMAGEINDLVDSYVRVSESNIELLQMRDRHSTFDALMGTRDPELLEKSRRIKEWARNHIALIDSKRKRLLGIVEKLNTSLDEALAARNRAT